MSKRWYVVHAYSGFENQVRKSLVERIQRAGMEERFG
jgi:transcriptional antiterminator NusG